MKHFLLILIAFLLIIPASAQVTSYTAPAGDAIWAINIDSPTDTTGTFELTQSNGAVVTGSWSYQWSLTGTTANTAIGSDSASFGSVLPLNLKMQIWNGDNVTNARQLRMGAGQTFGIWNSVVETTISASPIVSYRIDADQNVEIVDEIVSYEDANAALNPTPGVDLLALLRSYSTIAMEIFLSLMYWLNLLFVENLTLTVSLYMAGTMAYAINTSRNIFAFYKTWFKQQRALFEFIVNGFATVFQIVTQIAAVIGKAVGTVIEFAGSIIGGILSRWI